MSILTLLWAGTLGVIYLSSYYEMFQQNGQMLQAHAAMYSLPPSINGTVPPARPMPEGGPALKPGFTQSPVFQLSTFYTVALSYDGSVLEIRNGPPAVYASEDLEELARRVINSGRTTGTENNLAFYQTDKGGYTLVAFMDNTLVNQRALTLLRYTMVFGAAVLVPFFFLAVFLAKKIVGPLEESSRKQRQFISDAGHELKTPVSVVSANAELLSRELGANQWLANIQYENQRMAALVSQLLDLARTEYAPPQMEPIDFSRLVKGEALPFESIAFENGLALRCHIDDGAAVEGNSAQLRQLVSILLDNAVCHSAGRGEVCLKLAKEHGFARLSVTNPGEEIPKERRGQIFERFYRGDAARSGGGRHYGLGLAIARAVVLSHRGRIEVFCHHGLVEFQVQLPTV